MTESKKNNPWKIQILTKQSTILKSEKQNKATRQVWMWLPNKNGKHKMFLINNIIEWYETILRYENLQSWASSNRDEVEKRARPPCGWTYSTSSNWAQVLLLQNTEIFVSLSLGDKHHFPSLEKWYLFCGWLMVMTGISKSWAIHENGWPLAWQVTALTSERTI